MAVCLADTAGTMLAQAATLGGACLTSRNPRILAIPKTAFPTSATYEGSQLPALERGQTGTDS